MSLAQGNNTPTRPRIEPGSPDPESNALTTRPVRLPVQRFNSPLPKIALDFASESKHSHVSCSRKATFVFRVRLLECNFTEHLESNCEKTKCTVR